MPKLFIETANCESKMALKQGNRTKLQKAIIRGLAFYIELEESYIIKE
jgi:hypothetical protein